MSVCVYLCPVITVDCERDIEEHFRRSLGRDYCNYLTQSSTDCGTRQLSARCNGAAACSSAGTAPCSSASVTSSSRATMSDPPPADVDVCDSSCDVSRKCSAISVTGMMIISDLFCLQCLDAGNRCEWVNVFSGTGSPGLSQTKSREP